MTKKYIYLEANKTVKLVSDTSIKVDGLTEIETDEDFKVNDIYNINNMKLAYVCNWKQLCGISTYAEEIYNRLDCEKQIFSEIGSDEAGVQYVWERGKPLNQLLHSIIDYKATHVLIQHEWGIFPNVFYFMLFIQGLKNANIPVTVVLHSVYSHPDKMLPVAMLDNVIVHTETGKNTLLSGGYKGIINVIPHGCPPVNMETPVFNIFRTPYLVFGYGFGFKYKGIEVALDAIKLLKEKYPNILYVYCCSESENNKGIHENYYNILQARVLELGLTDNVLLLKGFLPPPILNIYLRMVKLVIFPYIVDEDGAKGASGAIKIAMSYNVPVIASKSALFDDIEGNVIRISNEQKLATNIGRIFSNSQHRQALIEKAHQYVRENSWDTVAEMYMKSIHL